MSYLTSATSSAGYYTSVNVWLVMQKLNKTETTLLERHKVVQEALDIQFDLGRAYGRKLQWESEE